MAETIWLCAREHDDGSVVAVSGDTRRYVGSFVCGPDRPCYFPSDIGDPTHNARCGWYEQMSKVSAKTQRDPYACPPSCECEGGEDG